MNTISNYVQLIGKLGRDVEFRPLNNGNAMARLRVATKEVFRETDGDKRIVTTWHNVVAWGKIAEMMQVMLKKGAPVLVQGKLQHRLVGEGEARHLRTEVIVNEFRLLN